MVRQLPMPPGLHLRQSPPPAAPSSVWSPCLWASMWGYSALSKDMANCDTPSL